MAVGDRLRFDQLGLQGLNFLLESGDHLVTGLRLTGDRGMADFGEVDLDKRLAVSLERERGQRCRFARARAASAEILSLSPSVAYVSISTGITFAPV